MDTANVWMQGLGILVLLVVALALWMMRRPLINTTYSIVFPFLSQPRYTLKPTPKKHPFRQVLETHPILSQISTPRLFQCTWSNDEPSFLLLDVPDPDLNTTFQEFQALSKETGYHPVILEPRQQLWMLIHPFQRQHSVADVSQQVLGEGFQTKREALERERLDHWNAPHFSEESHSFPSQTPYDAKTVQTGIWLPTHAVEALQELTLPKQKQSLSIGLFKTDHPWKVLSHLKFGYLTQHATLIQQSAMLRHWEETYGATLSVLILEGQEFQVSHPIQDQETALQLAWEVVLYCGLPLDTVTLENGEEVLRLLWHDGVAGYDYWLTLEELAARFLGAHVWSLRPAI